MRTGKIARIPHHLREELNRRLRDGEICQKLLDWLNAIPEVQAILQAHFHGEPIKQPNLSQWVQGGYQDWVQRQEGMEISWNLMEHAQDLNRTVGPNALSDHYGNVLTIQLVQSARRLLTKDLDAEEYFARVSKILKQVDRLRRNDHQAERLRLQREKQEQELRFAAEDHAAAVALKQRPAAAAPKAAGRATAKPAADAGPRPIVGNGPTSDEETNRLIERIQVGFFGCPPKNPPPTDGSQPPAGETDENRPEYKVK